MRTHRVDSVRVFAVTRAAVLKVALDGRYQDQGRGKRSLRIQDRGIDCTSPILYDVTSME